MARTKRNLQVTSHDPNTLQKETQQQRQASHGALIRSNPWRISTARMLPPGFIICMLYLFIRQLSQSPTISVNYTLQKFATQFCHDEKSRFIHSNNSNMLNMFSNHLYCWTWSQSGKLKSWQVREAKENDRRDTIPARQMWNHTTLRCPKQVCPCGMSLMTSIPNMEVKKESTYSRKLVCD